MRSPVAACWLMLLSCCHLPASAASRVGDVEVRAGANGEPCFTIPEREERRAGAPNFDTVTVSEAGGKRALMWKMAMPAERTFPVTFSMCIPYAGRVPALPQTTAAELEPGKVYYVRIDARKSKGGNPGPAYDARFCLARQHDGSMLVHHIGREDNEGRRMYGCLAPPD